MSVEFANWASNEAAGDAGDGSFFDDCLSGFRRHGICREATMPYQAEFDPESRPSAAATREAGLVRREPGSFEVRWILPPRNDDPGLTPRQLAEVKAILMLGYPVAFGSGHSVLLVGFQDDATKPGGGEFLIKDSGAAAFKTDSYEFVRTKPYDVFWVEFFKKPLSRERSAWDYGKGVFRKASDGTWIQTAKDGGKWSFEEAARTDECIELRDASRHLVVRIYGYSYSKLFFRTPATRAWGLMYDGAWVE